MEHDSSQIDTYIMRGVRNGTWIRYIKGDLI